MCQAGKSMGGSHAVVGYCKQQMISVAELLPSVRDAEHAPTEALAKLGKTVLKLQWIIKKVLGCTPGPVLDSFLQLSA